MQQTTDVGSLDRIKILLKPPSSQELELPGKAMEIEVDYLAQLNPMDAIGLLDGDDLTGLMLWPSAQFLAQFLASHQKQLAGARVIELGAGGTGLPGLAAAQFCHSVLLTDNNPIALQVLRTNATHNDCASTSSSSSSSSSDSSESSKSRRIDIRNLAWGREIGDTDLQGQFDLVVGADVIYDFEGIELIAASIEQLLANPTVNSCAILTFTERLEEYRPALAAACDRHNLRLAAVLVQQECEYGATITVLIHSTACLDPVSLIQSWTLDPSSRWSLTTEKRV